MLFKKLNERKLIKKNNKRKIDCLNKLDSISNEICNKGIRGITVKIENLRENLDNPNLFLTSDQLDLIEKNLESIDSHLDNSYSEYIHAKINKIASVIKNENLVLTEKDLVYESNEDLILDIETKISELVLKREKVTQEWVILKEEIERINKKQEEVIDNKIEWITYYHSLENLRPKIDRKQGELKFLKTQIKIEEQNLAAFINQNRNIETSESLTRASKLAHEIEKQKDLVDTELAEMNAKFAHEQYGETIKTSEKLESVVVNYFGDQNQEFESDAELAYQRAFENRAIENMQTSVKQQSKNVK